MGRQTLHPHYAFILWPLYKERIKNDFYKNIKVLAALIFNSEQKTLDRLSLTTLTLLTALKMSSPQVSVNMFTASVCELVCGVLTTCTWVLSLPCNSINYLTI
jgi:hypothetical protein